MEDRKTISQEEMQLVIDVVKANGIDEDIIERLIHLKDVLKKKGKGRKITDRERKMARIRRALNYYSQMPSRSEADEIKLQNAVFEYNKFSRVKTVRVVGTKLIYEEK